MSTILVTGANGQLGSELRELSSSYGEHHFIFTCKDDLDITQQKELEQYFEENTIDVIINCAAYTAVDKAEEEAFLADTINHQGVKHLALIAKQRGIKLIHISSDYVFDGKHFMPYKETDEPNPISVYGTSKRAGEQAILEINPQGSIILRTSWVYSSYDANFVKTMLSLGAEKESLTVIYDQVGAPTYARDLAKVILEIIPRLTHEGVEIFHYANEGVLSWFDFAKEIMKMAKLTCTIMPIETHQYPLPAKRPQYALLNKSKIKEHYELEIPYWKDSLKECLIKMGICYK